MRIEERVRKLIEEKIEDMGYKLIKVTYGFEEGRKALTIFIDKKGGVTIEDCRKVSQAIDPLLDEADIIKESYILIVSSPGI